MKCVWALAAVAIVLALVVLAGGSGSHSGDTPAAYLQPQYFTKPDPARAVIEYGVSEGGRTTIYNTHLAR